MSKRMSLAEFNKQIVWLDEEEAAERMRKDLAGMRVESNPYEPVADTQATRSLIPQGTTNTLGEHDPQLRRELRHSVF